MVTTHFHYSQHLDFKERIRKKFKHTCQICGRRGSREVDHIIPWSISHDSSEANLRVLCKPCNLSLRRPRIDRALSEAEYNTWLRAQLDVV